MKMLNRQLMFNHAVAALIQQGKPSMGLLPFQTQNENTDKSCVYRSPDGSKCALGHCIPDARYKSSIEGKSGSAEEVMLSIDSKFGSADLRRSYENLGGPDDPNFLLNLQEELHDSLGEIDDPDLFRSLLQNNATKFADHHGLKVDANLFIVKEEADA